MADINVNSKLSLRSLGKESGYPVTDSDWKRLRKLINRTNNPEQLYLNIGIASLTLFVSTLITVITLTVQKIGSNGVQIFLWSTVGSTLVGSALCFIFHVKSKNRDSYLKQDALDCMDEIEAKCKSESEEQTKN